MRADTYRVLIVGAGIAGLASARALHGWGAKVEIVERSAATTDHGSGIYLPGNAFRALYALGFGAQILAASVRILRQRILDHRSRLLTDIDVGQVWHEVGPCLALPRAKLHQVLRDGTSMVPIRFDCTPTAITGAEVTFDDGTTTGYDLVIGADGVHSTVRRLVFDEPARLVGQYARRFVVPWPDTEPVWTARLGAGTTFLTLPIGDGRMYCYCDAPMAQTPTPLRTLLRAYSEPVPAMLDALEAAGPNAGLHGGPIEEVVLASWSRGPVLLIGDAAHATSPNMAEGAAMAVEDAIVLADTLDGADTTASALRTFEARRRTRTDWVLTRTHNRDRTRGLPSAIRNPLLRITGKRLYRTHYRPLLATP